MAKRDTPNYRGALGRRLDPWRDNVPNSLDDNYRKLMIELGLDPRSSDADARALRALSARHPAAKLSTRIKGGEGRRELLSAASKVVPGFQLSLKGSTLEDFYAARRRLTKKPHPERERIMAFVLAVNMRASPNENGRRVGVKRAINDLVRIGQPFDDLRRSQGDLEEIYYRHRRWAIGPTFPSLAHCARPDGMACFGEDPYFDEVPGSCKLRASCRFWKVWEIWASHAAVELDTERRALGSAVYYRRLISP